MSWLLSSVRSFTTGKNILTTRVSRMLHMFQVGYINTHSYTQTNKNHTVPSDVFFVFSLKQTFIRLTHQMMTFPVWQAGVFIRSMVGMQQPPFKKTKNKQKINPKVNLLQHIPEWSDHNLHLCVAESEYRPLLPYSESTSQILLSSLNPVDNRRWRRKSWKWKVLKVLKVLVHRLEWNPVKTCLSM